MSPFERCSFCTCLRECVLSDSVCDPMDCSSPGSSVHGILHSRILGWLAISSSRRSSQPRDQTCISYIAGGFFTAESLQNPYTHMLYFTVKMMPMMGIFLVVQGLRLCVPNAGDQGSIPDPGTRSHMPQLSLRAATKDRRKILRATAKTPYSQINSF